MRKNFAEHLAHVIQLQPEAGLQLALEAFRSKRLFSTDSVGQVPLLEHLVTQAIEQSRQVPSALFRLLFISIKPSAWREAMGDHGLEGISTLFDGKPLTRYLLNYWCQQVASETLKSSPLGLENWFAELVLPPVALPEEAPGQLLNQCLTLGLERYSERAWSVSPALALGDDGLPAIVAAHKAEAWERFMAESPDVLQPVNAKGLPLIVATLSKKSASGAFRRTLQEQTLSSLVERPHASPEGQAWAHQLLQSRLRQKNDREPAEWLRLLQACGPALVSKSDGWEKVGSVLGRLSWFDTLRADPVFATAIGSSRLTHAQYRVAFELLGQPDKTIHMVKGEVSSLQTLLRHLKVCLEQHPLPLAEQPWITQAAFKDMGAANALKLASLMGAHGKAWWGPDQAATERSLFIQLSHTVCQRDGAQTRSFWKPRVDTFLKLTANDEAASAWLPLTRSLAETMMMPLGKQRLESDALLEWGASTLVEDTEALNALSRMTGQFGTAQRPLLGALRKGWAMHKNLNEAPVSQGPKTRL